MINVDFEGLRQYRSDGRKNNELRNTSIQLGVDAHADGSCRFQQGLTEVLCLVHGPYQRPPHSDALFKIQYTVAPFSSLEKRKGKHDRQFTQFAQNVRKSFEGAVPGEVYKKSQIEVVVTVLQNEGSAKSAVMNCISLALIDAGVTLKDLLVSCGVGMLGGQLIVDLNGQEQYDSSNEFVISYLPGSQTLDCLQLRKAKLREQAIEGLHNQAISACQELYQRLRRALMNYSIRKMLIF